QPGKRSSPERQGRRCHRPLRKGPGDPAELCRCAQQSRGRISAKGAGEGSAGPSGGGGEGKPSCAGGAQQLGLVSGHQRRSHGARRREGGGTCPERKSAFGGESSRLSAHIGRGLRRERKVHRGG